MVLKELIFGEKQNGEKEPKFVEKQNNLDLSCCNTHRRIECNLPIM